MSNFNLIGLGRVIDTNFCFENHICIIKIAFTYDQIKII